MDIAHLRSEELFKHSRLSCPTQTFSVILLAPLSNAEDSGYMFGYTVHVKDHMGRKTCVDNERRVSTELKSQCQNWDRFFSSGLLAPLVSFYAFCGELEIGT